jgi:EAL domain-containing protein (putative c-di-GMP-specific phosphodiesterase class I)/GGDEF domain-containing protein
MVSLLNTPPGFNTVHLDRILREEALRVEFQPVVDLRGRSIHAYEALIRGPQGSALERPDALFATAREAGRTQELDRLCVRASLAEFARQKLPGLLFLNITQSLFDCGWLSRPGTLDQLQKLGLEPSRLVLELLESDELLVDTHGFEEAQSLNRLGYGLALDDLGQGFGRFNLWQRLHPRYLKIDRAFCNDLSSDPLKVAFIRSMLLMAEASQSWVIAEGVESERDLLTLRDIGVQMAQGYFLERPSMTPSRELAPELRRSIDAVHMEHYALASRGSIEQSVLGLARPIAAVAPAARLEEVLRRFDLQPDLMSIPVVDAAGRALGILNRYVLADRLWRPHVRDLFGNKPCSQVMSSDVLRLDVKSSLHQASNLIADASFRHATEGVLITEQGQFRGLLLVGDLLRLVSEFQMQAARYANPLTLLPGNVPINDHIDRLLAGDARFTAAYCDIDHFKPFNDVYGYRMGDEVIQLVADLIKAAFSGPEDFVGHIGGDDFIVLSTRDAAIDSLQQVLDRFGTEVRRFFDAATVDAGGYFGESRRGESQFFALPSLSIGVLPVQPRCFDSHREVSSVLVDLKKAAKQLPGNRMFVDRRSHDPATRSALGGLEGAWP